MFKHLTGDKWLSLTAVIAALLLIFVWVPLDIDTGLVEKVRRQIRLGDSLEPSLSLRPVNLVAYEEAFPHNAGAVLTQLPYGGDMMLAMRAQDRDAIRVLMKHRNAVEAGGGDKAGATGVGVPSTHAMASKKATEK